ncbi:MAG: cation diffusion facilitator family transporter [Acidimicrobiales bacterium]
MSGHGHAAGHEGADHHRHDAHEHRHRRGPVGFVIELVGGHSHDHADSLDDSLIASRAGMRALVISLSGLLVTATLQLIVFSISDSVGLLADTIHNFADAFTALPIGVALLIARRPATRRYTYGFGRAEDLAGLAVLLVIAGSAVIAAWEAVSRIVHPGQVTNLGWVASAGAIGFIGNELAARYRIQVGRQIGSAALVADGHHARTDGFTSLAVVAGAIGVSLGWRLADPIVGLAITVAILGVLRGAARDIYRRLMDAVDPALVDQVEHEAADVDGVHQVDDVRVRWIGHELRAELNLTVDGDLHVSQAHDIAEHVRHRLLHHIHRLADATIHTDPATTGPDPHGLTAHHYNH